MADKQADLARTALKGAIVARNEVASRVEATRQALERLEDQLHEGWRKLREVRAHAGEGERAEVERLIAGGSATLLERVDGRASEAEAQRQIDAVKSARELTRAALGDGERSLDLAEMRVRDAVGSVLATAAGKLIAEAEAARKTFEGKVGILRFVRSGLGDEARRRVDAVSAYPTDFDNGPRRAAWVAAGDALGFLWPDPDNPALPSEGRAFSERREGSLTMAETGRLQFDKRSLEAGRAVEKAKGDLAWRGAIVEATGVVSDAADAVVEARAAYQAALINLGKALQIQRLAEGAS